LVIPEAMLTYLMGLFEFDAKPAEAESAEV
jgi:hypothetical protein